MAASSSVATPVVDPCWLVDKPSANYLCQVCWNVLRQPTSGLLPARNISLCSDQRRAGTDPLARASRCPEGHCFCKECYTQALQSATSNKSCPSCRFSTNETKLVRCRPLENLVGQLLIRCPNAVLDDSELPSPAKRAKTEEHAKMTPVELRKKLVQEHGLKIAPVLPCPHPAVFSCLRLLLPPLNTGAACVQGATRKDDFLALLKQHHASGCDWVGAISDLSSHLAANCMLATVPCTNAGCSAKLQRRDFVSHGIYCDFRQVFLHRSHTPPKCWNDRKSVPPPSALTLSLCR